MEHIRQCGFNGSTSWSGILFGPLELMPLCVYILWNGREREREVELVGIVDFKAIRGQISSN